MSSPPRSLGRGLSSLLTLPGSARVQSSGTVLIDSVQPGSMQPRSAFGEEEMESLIASIRSNGLVQPILVRPLPRSSEESSIRYEIVAGERRWQAARRAGLTDIPAVVRTLSDREALAAALIENIQREELNPLDEARGFKRLIAEFAMTHEQVAQAVGRSRAAVSNLIRLLELPDDVGALIERKALSMGHARALLGLSARQMQSQVGKMIADRGLSVRQTEKLVRRAQSSGVNDSKRHTVGKHAQELLCTEDVRIRLKAAPNGRATVIVDVKNARSREALIAALHQLFAR